MSLIKQIEDAETKDQLEAIGKQSPLSVDVDKRKGVETIRAELMEMAEEAAASESGEKGGDENQVEPAQEGLSQNHGEGEAADSDGGTATGEPGTADEHSAPKPASKRQYSGRLLKNRKTGRLFPWTAQLAKKREMQEV